MSTINQIATKLDSQMLLSRPLHEWHPLLAQECQVYQLATGNYLAKRFSQIQYEFCDAKTASMIIEDNLHALLRYKYFTSLSDEILERINQIIRSFTINLSATLLTVTFNKTNASMNDSLRYIKDLPDGCIAFRNGVYDFRSAKWLFKYDIIKLKTGQNIVEYTLEYVVRFYFNIEFEPLDLAVNDFTLKEFLAALKDLNETRRNLCFELCYNISHDEQHVFDYSRFEHLCQILGYMCLNSFSQHFVLLFGAGQNGKNSLFDGCFTHHIIPKPASNDLDIIENNQFVTGALEGKCHNIYLEAEAKTYRNARAIKALTGSPEQSIERKGVGRYSGIINCKFLFAGNERDDIKFGDTSMGFIRRVNVYNIHYTYDKEKRFLKRGDYYDASFSDDLRELKNDDMCAIVFIYLAMFGIKTGTKDFTKMFDFTHNEWSLDFSDINTQLKTQLEKIKIIDILKKASETAQTSRDFTTVLYGINRMPLWKSQVDPSEFNLPTQDLRQRFEDAEGYVSFTSANEFLHSTYSINIEGDDIELYLAEDFVEYFDELFIDIGYLRDFISFTGSARQFSQQLVKIYGQSVIERLSSNRPYIRCTFKRGGKFNVVK